MALSTVSVLINNRPAKGLNVFLYSLIGLVDAATYTTPTRGFLLIPMLIYCFWLLSLSFKHIPTVIIIIQDF